MNKKCKTIFLLAAILSLVGCSVGNQEETSKLEPPVSTSSIAPSSQITTSSTGGESQNQSSSNTTSSKISSSLSSSNVSSSESKPTSSADTSKPTSSSTQPTSSADTSKPTSSSTQSSSNPSSSSASSSEASSQSSAPSSSEAPSSSQSSSSASSSSQSSSSESSSSSEPVEVYYHITYKNYDGTILEEKDVLEGSEAIYTGETPTREDDEEYTYEFTGWDKEDDLKVVSADITVTAQFKATGIWGPIIWF